jgi:N-acetylglucosamine-6-sulfatase
MCQPATVLPRAVFLNPAWYNLWTTRTKENKMQTPTRIFFTLILLAGISGVFGISLSACQANVKSGNQDPNQPNIIIFMTDDQPMHTMDYMPVVQRELVDKGVNFTRAYATTPLCCPSRASIITGLFAQNTGVLTNRPGAPAFTKDEETIAVWFQEAGYRTGWLGKYFNNIDRMGIEYRPPGWDDYQILWDRDKTYEQFSYFYGYLLNNNGKLVSYGHEAEDYSTDVFTAKAREFIEVSGEQPFMLVVSYYAPHYPYDSAERHKERFTTDEEWKPHYPPNFLEEDRSDKPEWVQKLKSFHWNYAFNSDQAMLRSMLAVDEGVEEILELLEKRQIRDNTVILFLSDNGMAVGEHHIIGKDCPYEECIQIPFVVAYPRLENVPRVENKFALNIDIAPTILDFANIPIPPGLDGASLVPLLQNPQADWRDHVFIEHYQDGEADDPSGLSAMIPTYWAIRTDEWKYVEYIHGERELYDMVNDRYELNNLAGQPEHEELMQAFSAQLQPFRYEP